MRQAESGMRHISRKKQLRSEMGALDYPDSRGCKAGCMADCKPQQHASQQILPPAFGAAEIREAIRLFLAELTLEMRKIMILHIATVY